MITIEDLKERWFNAYPEIMGISGDKPIQCYGKKDVDECLAGIEAVPRTDNSSVIVQLRGEVTMYRDAYRVTMRKLELANKELRNLRELRNMKENEK